MKLATFKAQGRASWGSIDGDTVVDLGAVLGHRFADLKTLIAQDGYAEAEAAIASAPRHSLAEIGWLPVIPNPAKILCVGLNYEKHRKETGRTEVAHPTIFTRFADTQTGHLTDIVRPSVSVQLDFEGELAVVIGKPGRHIPREQAHRHIAGYACYNDASVRDWQYHTHQFTPGKNFPCTGGFGPWMVTAANLEPLAHRAIATRLNGETVQQATLGEMIFDVATILAYCSAFTMLHSGDVIITGTPGGVGAKRTPPLWMKPGDTVEVEIDGIGVLRNTVADEAQAG